jgi:hypothetical protein
VKPSVAGAQIDAEIPPTPQPAPVRPGPGGTPGERQPEVLEDPASPPASPPPLRRFHGSVRLDSARVGRDAARIADEVISHLVAQMGAEVTVTLEIVATLPGGATDQLVRTVTENGRTLKFDSQGFERE